MVINGKLYVCDEYTGQGHFLLKTVRFMIFLMNVWSQIKNISPAINIDVSWVWKGNLLILGLTISPRNGRVFLYSPLRSRWVEDEALMNVLHVFRPLVSLAK